MEARAEEFKKTYSVEDYLALDEDTRAELINGEIIYMASASDKHQTPIFNLFFKFSEFFKDNKRDCIVRGGPSCIILFEDIDDRIRKTCIFEPDVFVVCDKNNLGDDGYHGAPPLIIEVTSNARAHLDITDKLIAYRDAGVKEYWVIEYEKQTVIVFDFISISDNHTFKCYTLENEIESVVFPGFKIKVSSLFKLGYDD